MLGADRHTICCPFHSEKTPSCLVDLKRWKFFCFGCGAKGTALPELVHTGYDVSLVPDA